MDKKNLHIKDAIENTKALQMTNSSVNTLLDFERVIDELDCYAFANWKNGELVAGPKYERYFVTCTFMWPYKSMPDPRGGERLIEYGCTISYRKDVLEYPIKVKSPDDYKPGTRMPKLGKAPVWLVEIVMPKQLMQEINQGSVELESGNVDAEDIEASYEEGLDDNMYKTDSTAQGTASSGADDNPDGQINA
tara:strand:+ start:1226 stop:1801 length:576 start_codon:yes stop_codon:yes gene_type:complete